jgi:chromosome segregation ATPase
MFLLFGICLAASPASAAQDQPMHSDLAEMNATLKEIARALKQQAETQKADLMLKRITLATTQLAKARERLNGIDQEMRARESERGEFETLLAAAQKEPATPGRPASREQIAEIKARLQGLQERLSALRQERVAVENEIEALRREARDWQTLLDKTITGGS